MVRKLMKWMLLLMLFMREEKEDIDNLQVEPSGGDQAGDKPSILLAI